MTAAHWFLAACFVVFALGAWYRIFRAFPRPGSAGLARIRGDAPRAVLYSLGSAMLPWKKETAHRHLVSYALGVAFHGGVSLGFAWLVLKFFGVDLGGALEGISALLLLVAALAGLALLIKRIITPDMRYFSNPDDYFSNIIVTGFLILAAAALRYETLTSPLFIYSGLLLLYIPIGKLRHSIYFVLARVYLGLFYGRRGVWPARGRS
jgi:nitrate reductase gamma subunit